MYKKYFPKSLYVIFYFITRKQFFFYLLAIVILEFSVSKYIILVIFRNIYGVRDIFRFFF